MRARPGFTLIEALAALVLALLLAAGLAAIFRAHRRIAQRQAQTADLQQSARILGGELARVARVAGRGGLPARIALETRNGVPLGARIGDPGSPLVAAGTDVLIVRGVFAGSLTNVSAVESRGEGAFDLEVLNRSPLGEVQDLDEWVEALAGGEGEALVLSAEQGAGIAIVELTGSAASPDPGGAGTGSLTVTVRISGSELADGYRALAEATELELAPERALRVGILEEHRYYTRISTDPFSGDERVRVARARFYPGSDRAHPSSPTAGEDLIDHALDLQVALGYDLDRDGAVSEGSAEAERRRDEWLMNDPADDAGDPIWAASNPALVRLTGWLRSARPQLGYVAPAMHRLEDRLYEEPEAPGPAEMAQRRFLRAEVRRTIRRRNP